MAVPQGQHHHKQRCVCKYYYYYKQHRQVDLHQDEIAAPYDYDSKYIYHHYHTLMHHPIHPLPSPLDMQSLCHTATMQLLPFLKEGGRVKKLRTDFDKIF